MYEKAVQSPPDARRTEHASGGVLAAYAERTRAAPTTQTLMLNFQHHKGCKHSSGEYFLAAGKKVETHLVL